MLAFFFCLDSGLGQRISLVNQLWDLGNILEAGYVYFSSSWLVFQLLFHEGEFVKGTP